MLYGQLQEGLRYDLMGLLVVSGASGHQQLCLVARNEEKHLVELGRQQQYQKPLGSNYRPSETEGTHTGP